MSASLQKAHTEPRAEEKAVEFLPFGASDKIRLTASMVRQFIAVPTRSGALPSERDCIKFIMLCRGKRANPYEGDCFMIGYDTKDGPSFSLVCGIELFLKRAEQSEDYDGRESGVIVERAGTITERQGALVIDGENLVGGWAKVYRKNHGRPEYKAVKFSVYNTGRSRWEKDPGGQIEKVALSQALRQAYPTALGGLYTQEEMQRVAESGDNIMQLKEAVAMPVELPAGKGAEPAQSANGGTIEGPTPTLSPGPEAEPGENQERVHEKTVVGQVEQLTAKPTRTGGKNYGIKIGGLWYNTFDEQLSAVAVAAKTRGVVVELAYVTNAKGFQDVVGARIPEDADKAGEDQSADEVDPNSEAVRQPLFDKIMVYLTDAPKGNAKRALEAVGCPDGNYEDLPTPKLVELLALLKAA